MKKTALVLSCLLLLATVAGANHCVVRTRTVVHATPVYHAPTYNHGYSYGYGYQQHHYSPPDYHYEVKKQVLAEFVQVPIYTALFTPPPTPPANDSGLRKELEALRAEIRSLRTPAPSNPPVGTPRTAPETLPPVKTTNLPTVAASPPVSLQGVLKAKCTQCHDSGIAEDKGGGFVLMDGDNLPRLTDREWRKVITHAYKGTMPPKGNKLGVAPLTDEEVGVLVEAASTTK